jgi:hypothetical protein
MDRNFVTFMDNNVVRPHTPAGQLMLAPGSHPDFRDYFLDTIGVSVVVRFL